jgi:hypothetical protein
MASAPRPRGAHLHARHEGDRDFDTRPRSQQVQEGARPERRVRKQDPPYTATRLFPDERGRVLLCRPVDRQLGANNRFESRLLSSLMKTRRAVHAVGIEQRNRGIAERRRALDERFGQ